MADLSLLARLKLNASDFSSGLKKVKSETTKFGSELASEFKGKIGGLFAGVATAGAMVGTFEHILEKVKEIRNASLQMGITPEQFQLIDAAARKAGLSAEDFTAALIKLGAARKDAAEGNLELRKSFADFGVTLADLQDPARSDLDLIGKIAKAASGQLNPAQRDMFRDLFGRRGPAFAGIMKDLDKFLSGETKPISLIKDEDVEKIHEAERAVGKVKKTIDALAAKALVNGMHMGETIWGRLKDFFSGETPERVKLVSGGIRESGEPAATAAAAAAAAAKPAALYRDKQAEKEMEEMAKSRVELEKAQRDLQYEKETDAGKELILRREINELLQEANTLQQEGLQTLTNQLLTEATRKELDLRKLTESKRFGSVSADSLAHIGGLSQGAGGVVQALNPLAQIARNTQATADSTRKLSENCF